MRWLLFLSILLIPVSLFGGTTGKIAGRVTDAETGEPISYVEVYIPETHLGDMANESGYFFILNVSPGTYAVRAQHIGYRAMVKEGVKVNADRTTFIDFALEETFFPMDEIVVVAKRPLVERDVTWKKAVVTGEEMENLPVATVDEVVALLGGVTEGAEGELHIRGGRSDEVLLVVDGVPMRNVLTGNFGGVVEKTGVNELTMLAGTYSAEYGDALSGILNIVTQEGGRKTEWMVEYLAFSLVPSPYRKKDWIGRQSDVYRDSTGKSLYEPQSVSEFPGQMRSSIGGPFPGLPQLRYFLSGNYKNEDSHLPFGYEKIKNGQLKLTYPLRPLKLEFSWQLGKIDYQNYNHRWKYRPDHYPHGETKFGRESLTMRHPLSCSAFYTITVGRYWESKLLRVGGKSPQEYEDSSYDDFMEFFISGDAPIYEDSHTETFLGKGEITYQLGHHELKSGFEAKRHKLELFEMERLFFIGYLGETTFQEYTRCPLEGSLYLQDKIEYPYLVLNLGLRYDYADPGTEMWEDIKDPNSPLQPVKPKAQLSPRLGLAYPVTDRAVFHFSYGHFFQNPPYEVMYKHPDYLDPEKLPSQLALVGNPRLKAQKTVAYEAGLALGFGEVYSLDITTYAKDILDLLSTTSVRRFPYEYSIFSNSDFGKVRGLDISLKRRGPLGFSLSYTYQVARGNRSFPMRAFWDAYSGMPEAKKEYYLDFDRRHDLALYLNFDLPWGMETGLVFDAASGLPYTPWIGAGIVVEENSAHMPWILNLDILTRKELRFGPAKADLLLQVENLFDRKNARRVYSRTGDPWDAGPAWGMGIESEDHIKNPSHVGPRRTLKAGLRVSF